MMVLFAAIIGTGATVAFYSWLVNRLNRLESGTIDPAKLDRLLEQLEELRDQGELNREEIGELQERLDFAERLLTKGNTTE